MRESYVQTRRLRNTTRDSEEWGILGFLSFLNFLFVFTILLFFQFFEYFYPAALHTFRMWSVISCVIKTLK